jgi:hypothetical protein
MKWDNLLIKGWHRDAPMRNLVAMYLKDEILEFDQWNEIRRFPKSWEYPMAARVFVARYIPKLSERLFDKPEGVNYWLMLNGDKIKRLPTNCGTDKNKLKEDVSEIRMGQALAQRLRQFSKKDNDRYDAYKLSEQWGKCK